MNITKNYIRSLLETGEGVDVLEVTEEAKELYHLKKELKEIEEKKEELTKEINDLRSRYANNKDEYIIHKIDSIKKEIEEKDEKIQEIKKELGKEKFSSGMSATGILMSVAEMLKSKL